MKRFIITGLALCLLIFAASCAPPPFPAISRLFNNSNVEATDGVTIPHTIDKHIYEQGRLNLGALYQESDDPTEYLKIYSTWYDADEYIEVCTGPTTIASCATIGRGPNTYVRISGATAGSTTCAAEAMVQNNYIEIRPKYTLLVADVQFTTPSPSQSPTDLSTLIIRTTNILDESDYGSETIHQFKIKEEPSTCTGASVRLVDTTGGGLNVEYQLTRPNFYYVRQGCSDTDDTASPEITETYPAEGDTNIPVDVVPWFRTDDELGYVAAFVCKYTAAGVIDNCNKSGIEVTKLGTTNWRYKSWWSDDLGPNTQYGYTIFVGLSDDAAPDPETRGDWITKGTQDINGNMINLPNGPLTIVGDLYNIDLWAYRYDFTTAP